MPRKRYSGPRNQQVIGGRCNGRKVVIGTRMPKDADDTASGFTGLENVFEVFKKTFPEL
jgi:hypothetical protein